MHETRPVRETETLGGLPPSVFFFVSQMLRRSVSVEVSCRRERKISSELTAILCSFSGVGFWASRTVGREEYVLRPPVTTNHGWFSSLPFFGVFRVKKGSADAQVIWAVLRT